MRNALVTAVLLAVGLTLVSGQEVRNNVNVLPVYVNPSDPLAFYKGDLYLQRQLEPTIVMSTRNPNNLAAFYINYNTVNFGQDVNVGEGLASQAAPSEANIGFSRSRDGGLTWTGALLPGLSFDNVPSPIKNYAATSDPVALAGPCGAIYLVLMAFNRDVSHTSAMVVAKFADLDNNAGGKQTIVYKGMSVVDTANNSAHGPFIDRPSAAIDLEPALGPCGHRIWAAHSVFTGFTKDNKFQSKVVLSTQAFANETSSLDGVTGWTTREVSGSYTQNQGTAMAVNPKNGDLYVFWRHFFKPDTMVFAKANRSDAAAARLGKPAALFSDTMAPSDQPPVPIDYAGGPSYLAFRYLSIPTAAITVDGDGLSHVFAAWAEKLDTAGSPNVNGSSRIVYVRSDNNGASFTSRTAADNVARPAEPAGQGYAQGSARPALPQVFPVLSAGGGQLMLAYFEARSSNGDSGLGPLGHISGYNRILDFRGASLDRKTGARIKGFQISRYPIKPWALDPLTSNSIDDLEPVNPPCFEDFGTGPPCVRRINRGVPQSAAGKEWFPGDYNALTFLQFVPNGSGGWKWATQPSEVPSIGALTAFADNRNVSPPTTPVGTPEPNRYAFFDAPGQGIPCTNPGSRDT